MEVDRVHHDECLHHFNGDAESTAPFSGWLANDLRLYPGILGSELSVELSDKHRPMVYLLPEASHLLAVEQRRGIGLKRHHEIVEQYSE